MNDKSLFEAERSSLYRISRLPQPILETILCLLPTTQAARTSILSREWRYKWTTIPKLEFYHYKPRVSEQTFDMRWKIRYDSHRLEQTSDMKCKPCCDIHQILLLHQGPIHEVTLRTPGDECLEFDQIILHLSMNYTVKKLSLIESGCFPGWYRLPACVFSFHHLTDLRIFGLDLHHPPIFNGFGNLQSLYLKHVGISTKTLLHLLSNCPSLKSLTLFICPSDVDGKYTINELFKCLPVIEHLTTWPLISLRLVLDSVRQELPSSLIHLKYFCFEEMSFADGYGLSFLLVLIKCSPNLEKIKLQNDCYHLCDEEHFVVWEDYSDVWLEHLNELEIECFYNYKPEMEFVKFILARSPKLKKVSLLKYLKMNQESEMLKTLFEAPRASPVVITIK